MQIFPKSVSEADKKVFDDISRLVEVLREKSKDDPENVADGISLLKALRKDIYEELNQIQHEGLAVRAVEWLRENGYGDQKLEWFWNPRQTGDDKEPDVRAVRGGVIMASAEASASESPKGSIDTHMASTLNKLSKMDGEKFYFVRTGEMEKRAETKIEKSSWNIRVVKL
ncbi:MAG TPA: hypothetical protein ENI76_09380 [Ignavibacteria bacterium]|nr:hypothetical protein [Ignavibacteria bacterium]